VFERARRLPTALKVIDPGGRNIAIQAARNFRTLRSLSVTVRKTIDVAIATRCIAGRLALLFSDRDSDPFVRHLGPQSAMQAA